MSEKDGIEENNVENIDKPKAKSRLKQNFMKILTILNAYQIPLCLILFTIFGLAYPPPALVILIFFQSGLKLKTDDATLLGVVCILGITPLYSIPLLKIGYAIPSYAVGFAIFWNSPCTMSSGVVITEECQGNFVLALLLTVISNILCILTEPFMISFLFSASNVSIKFNILSMLFELFYSIFLPLLVGKLFLYIPRVPEFVAKFNGSIRLISTICLVCIPWMKISSSASKILNINTKDIAYILGLSIGGHLLFVVTILLVCFISRISSFDSKAILFMGASKTLPVAITVLSFMPTTEIDPGLAIIPMLISHFCQLMLAAIICAIWKLIDVKKKIDNKEAEASQTIELIDVSRDNGEEKKGDNNRSSSIGEMISDLNSET